ncbi:hypothetical protein BAUCODRAFT_71120 [Baudoinia panamericana UAMH 10762]|uniref:Copper transport protein n=1 Tax=Baudoinia panamericana (strain UAMH 10762) TaxID=717646 RepID=M2N9P9_BAUPA|nr:uncharacterized protein BAUCODRAFT_71120 [Baudoinia panamericana UAMH 10762]EMC95525.1 hypothetical protein BAUCODRAFT_71120 [Baudoinia panamericana UAMH 10762]
MIMVFFSSSSTPLYSERWTPKTTGQYAGTCIFLIILATIFRALLAVRGNIDTLMARWHHRHHTSLPQSDVAEAAKHRALDRAPWRVNDALLLATLDTLLTGVGYLLMLAVMTMNVGYFLSVLGGAFLGSFVFGRLAGPAAH